MKIFARIFFAIGWFKIFLAPLFIGLFLAMIVWIYLSGIAGLIIGILLVTIGLTAGIVFANRVSKNEDPNDAIAGIYETSDLDKMMEKRRADENETPKEEE